MKNTCASQDFILTAVRANGDVLRYASGWHCDPEVVLTAIEKVQHEPTTWGCRAGGAVCCWVHVDEFVEASHAVHYVDTRLRQRVEQPG